MEKTTIGNLTSDFDKTYYMGGFQYKDRINNYPNSKLQFFPTAEGYYKQDENAPLGVGAYIYNHTDHLGNVRLSYSKNTQNSSLIIHNSEDYYPFGLKHQTAVPNNQPQYKYKYNGKELQDELGLNWDSFKWRNYDYAIGRFMSVDPLAEK